MNHFAARFGRRVLLATVWLAVASWAGCNGEPTALRPDAGVGRDPQLIGSWSGTVVGGDDTAWAFVFSATEAQATSGGVDAFTATYSVDTQTDPKQLAAQIVSSSTPENIGETVYAIYAIDGSQLSLAVNPVGDPSPPLDFDPGGIAIVYELVRQ